MTISVPLVPEISIDPSSFDFGLIESGDILETSFTISNTGSLPLEWNASFNEEGNQDNLEFRVPNNFHPGYFSIQEHNHISTSDISFNRLIERDNSELNSNSNHNRNGFITGTWKQ